MSQYINAKVVDRGDPPPFPELLDKGVIKGELDKFCVLQGGMESGRASVGFFATLPNGTIVFTECSAAMLDYLHGISVGARKKWGEEIL